MRTESIVLNYQQIKSLLQGYINLNRYIFDDTCANADEVKIKLYMKAFFEHINIIADMRTIKSATK